MSESAGGGGGLLKKGMMSGKWDPGGGKGERGKR